LPDHKIEGEEDTYKNRSKEQLRKPFANKEERRVDEGTYKVGKTPTRSFVQGIEPEKHYAAN